MEHRLDRKIAWKEVAANLNGVQVVASSNPAAPTIGRRNQFVTT